MATNPPRLARDGAASRLSNMRRISSTMWAISPCGMSRNARSRIAPRTARVLRSSSHPRRSAAMRHRARRPHRRHGGKVWQAEREKLGLRLGDDAQALTGLEMKGGPRVPARFALTAVARQGEGDRPLRQCDTRPGAELVRLVAGVALAEAAEVLARDARLARLWQPCEALRGDEGRVLGARRGISDLAAHAAM